MSPLRTEGRHQFDSAIHKFSEVEARSKAGPSQVESRNERVQQSSNEHAESITANSDFEQQITEDSGARDTFNGTRPERAEEVEHEKAGIICRKHSCPSVQPERHPWLSSTVWKLAAMHKPLHAVRKAPTTRPRLQELAVRQNPRMSKCTRC